MNTVIYTRKSTESEDRQVLSIESQVKELRRFAQENGLHLKGILDESKSAKAPGRPVFSRLVDDIQKGEVESVLCWKLDRLARNPVDGAALIWAMEEGNLKHIVTPQRTFDNNSNDKFWMQLEFGIAKKYVDDLSDNVKRGMRAKTEKGWFPHLAPLGYLNDRATKTIVRDPDRFPIVKKMWDLMLSGSHTPPDILRIATQRWGLRTRQHNKKGGNPVARSAVYDMFSNPFYYGAMLRSGELHQGRHDPVVTRAEYDRVQELLGRKNSKRPTRHSFPFTGLIKCGECGAAVTASHHMNRYGHRYTYYHCTKRKNGIRCRQPALSDTDMEIQIIEFLDSITISTDFKTWTLGMLREKHAENMQADKAAFRSISNRYEACKGELGRLLDLKLRGLLDDQEFLSKKSELESEKSDLKARLEDNEHTFEGVLAKCEEAFNFVEKAQDIFVTGDILKKRAILSCLGLNFVLKDKKLFIHAQKPLELIRDGLSGPGVRNLMLEPRNTREDSRKNKTAQRAILSWSSTVDDVRTWFRNHRDAGFWLQPLRAIESTKTWGICKD